MPNNPKKPKIPKNPAVPQLKGDGPTPGKDFCWPGGCTAPPPGTGAFRTLIEDGWVPPGSVLVHVVHEGEITTFGWPGGGRPPPGTRNIVVFGWPGGGRPPPKGVQDAVTAGWSGGCTKPPPTTPRYAELVEKGWIPPGLVIARVVHPGGVTTLGWPGGGTPPPPPAPQGLHHIIAFGWPGGGIPPPQAPHHVVSFGWPGGGIPPPQGIHHIPGWPGGGEPPP